ncbi:transferase family-domain-containing protein [Aspergillus falconensis]
MATEKIIEQLTPLDLTSGGGYIPVIYTFKTVEPAPTVLQTLQHGLNKLVTQLPWLSGHVVPTTSDGKRRLQIEFDLNAPAPAIIDKGTIEASYAALAAQGMPADAIPTSVCPLPFPFIPDFMVLSDRAETVMAASIFRFADGEGAGLCVFLHHRTVDARGVCEVMRLWAEHTTSAEPAFTAQSRPRQIQLAKALAVDLATLESIPLDGLFALRPEFSRVPLPLPMPTELPPCTSKVFSIPIARVEEIKKQLDVKSPTTNTIISALLWSAVIRARAQRDHSIAGKQSRLVSVVNGRSRISETLSTRDTPYFGNLVFPAVTNLPAKSLGIGPADTELAKICAAISEAHSPARINPRYMAEVYALAERVDDYRSLHAGPFDLTITSWADLDIHQIDFGPGLGMSTFTRVPYMEADGVAIMLPRRRGAVGEMVEVLVMLRRDDMAVLEGDGAWKGLIL